MKRLISMLLCVALFLTMGMLPTTAKEAMTFELPKDITIAAKSALVVHLAPNAERDSVLFSKNADESADPAEMCRIMVGITALSIIQEKKLDMDTATGTYTDVCYQAIAGTGIPTAGMVEGDKWTLRDLLTVSVMSQVGDAVETLVHALCKNEAEFVSRMNTMATQIGCTDSSFKNVHGLENRNQVSTVNDLYRMLRYAMDNELLKEALSLSFYAVNPKVGDDITLASSNNMLRYITDSYYDPAVLGRSGWSDVSGPALATVARADGYEYMVVVMGYDKPTDTVHYDDSKALFRWAFQDFVLTTIRTKNDPIANLPVNLCWEQDQLQLVPAEDITAVIPTTIDKQSITVKPMDLPEELDAPIKKGQICGKAGVYAPGGKLLTTVNLVADKALEQSTWLTIWHGIGSFFSSGWFWGIFLVVAALVAGYVWLTIQHNKKRRAAANRRNRR